jgi:hypothetical protein
MYRVMFLIKRKSHLSHEQFQVHFERSHAAMALKFFGHLFLQYQRHYLNGAWYGGDSRKPDSGFGLKSWNWDLLSVWTLPDEETYREILRLMEFGEYAHYFEEDEDRFMDRAAGVVLPCTVSDRGVVFDPKGTVFETPTGEPSWDGWENWTPSA